MARLLRASLAAALAGCALASPLWDYVHTPDPHYSYFDTGVKLDGQLGWTGYLLNMTSQAWLSPADSSRYIWTHQVLVVIPWDFKEEYAGTGALWITGGGNNNPGAPSNSDEDVLACASLATATGTVCGVVYQIPNEPIVFPADPLQKQRSEDAAVAFTWVQYMTNHTDDPTWVLYFPMVKAASRAMDTIADYAPKVRPGSALKQWMVFGASKRGETTWLTGAVDGRVIGIAPVVWDLLNMREVITKMWQSLGGWTFAFQDYWDLQVPVYLNSPALDHLAAQMDPISYKENLTMPKLVIDATGDEFFQIQDDSAWWGQLPGETLRMMVDNAEHSMATGALYLITGVEAWFSALLRGTPRPTFTWQRAEDHSSITITATGTKPSDVVMRFATTVDGNTRRDFRLISGNTPANPCKFIPVQVFGSACLKPILWIGESVAPVSNTSDSWTYVISQPPPPEGWRGYLAELYYPGPEGTNTTFQLTTQVAVVPNTYPFPPCEGEACQGELV